jgi:hypothetical protein
MAEIQAMIGQGHSIRAVYDAMRERKKISVCYQQFCRYVVGRVGGVRGILSPRVKRRKDAKGSEAKVKAVSTGAQSQPVAAAKPIPYPGWTV